MSIDSRQGKSSGSIASERATAPTNEAIRAPKLEDVERALGFVATFQGDGRAGLNCFHSEALAAEVYRLRALAAPVPPSVPQGWQPKRRLGFALEKRGETWCVVWPDGGTRPASLAEIELWTVLASLPAQGWQPACVWSLVDEDHDDWHPSCGGAPWVFNEDGPVENGVRFCVRCGARVEVAPASAAEK